MKYMTPKRTLMLVIAIMLLALKTISCDGGAMSCDMASLGCEGCEGGGIETLPYLAYPEEHKIENMAQVRVTSYGFQFIQANALSIAEMALGGELAFPMEEMPLKIGSWEVCKIAPGGTNIKIPISQIKINPQAPPANNITAVIELPSNARIDLPTSCGCDVGVNFENRLFYISVTIQPYIDGETNLLSFEVYEPQFDIDQVHIDMGTGGVLNFVCKSVGGLADTIILPFVRGFIKTAIRDLVSDLIDGIKCANCKDGKVCPDPDGEGVSCDDRDICLRPNKDCILQPLGLEMGVDVGALLADIIAGMESKLWASLVAGGRAAIEENGLEIGMFGGTISGSDIPALNGAPAGKAPVCTDQLQFVTQNLNPIPMGNMNNSVLPPQKYHVGIGLQEALLDQAGYSIQNSGLLCMGLEPDALGEEVSQYLSIPNLAFLGMGSIRTITHGENAPLLIKLQPSKTPIDFAILDGSQVFTDAPETDVALRVTVKDLGLNFWAQVDNRYVRLIELMVDINVHAGLDVQTGAIQPIFGLDNVKIENLRVPYSTLKEDPQEITTLFQGLIDTAFSMIPLDPFDPIEIPDFDINSDDVNDLGIDIQSASAEMPKDKNEAPSATKEYEALVIYAGIKLTNRGGARQSAPFIADTEVKIDEIFLPTREQILNEKMRPWVSIKLSGNDQDGGEDNIEYQISLDGKRWTAWFDESYRKVEANRFLLQGNHRVYVRARDNRHPLSYDRTPAVADFLVDMIRPEVSIKRNQNVITFVGTDNVSEKQALHYRTRINGATWSSWSKENNLDLYSISKYPATVMIQVKDEAGKVSTLTRKFTEPDPQKNSYRISNASKLGAEDSGSGATGTTEGGCQSSTSFAAWLLGALLMSLYFIRRRVFPVKGMVSLLAIATFALAYGGCSDSGSVSCVKNTDCGIGEACINGTCQDAGDGGDIDKGDMDPIDNDKLETEESAEGMACVDGKCPDCYYCSIMTNTCEVQRCDPDCAEKDTLGITACSEQMTQKDGSPDTCAVCLTDSEVYECKVPRCKEDSDCSCRECPDGIPQQCVKSTGVCKCTDICGGGCAEGALCCTSLNAAGTCHTCPHWCEDKTCDPGFGPGGCNPEEEEDPAKCAWAGQWSLCGTFDEPTCSFSGVGLPEHSSCDCTELPHLPIGTFGIFSDMAIHDEEDVWLSSYNETYGDLMVGRTKVSRLALGEVNWDFIDGVPVGELVGGPSGPRGGVEDAGDDVGKYTSIAVTSDNWPRIAYQDYENGDLVLIYTNGEPPVDPPLLDGDEEAEAETPDVDGDEDTATEDVEDTEATETRGRSEGDEGPTEEYPSYGWTRVVVDDMGETGYYTDIYLDDQNRPVIVYMMASDAKMGEKKDQLGTVSAVKLAYAKTATPKTKEDFHIITIDEAPIGPRYCGEDEPAVDGDDDAAEGETATRASRADCSKKPVQMTYGIGLNPTIGTMASGKFWIFYYHNTSFSTREDIADNYKVGVLKKASLDAGLPEKPKMLKATDFTKEVFLGKGGVLEVEGGDAGLFNSFYSGDTLDHYVLAFYNSVLNRLEYVFDLGDGLKHKIADDGYRKINGEKKTIWLGADCAAALDGNGAVRIVYQNQNDMKLLYYSEQCDSDGTTCTDRTVVPVLEMKEGEGGKAYGWYPTHWLVGLKTVSVVSTYTIEFDTTDSLDTTNDKLEVKVMVAPPQTK